MHRALKADNKLCYARDIEHRQRIHRQKLATMRPTSKSNSKASLDNNRPQRHRHLELKLKKRQLDDEQYTKIERENRILMEKMYSIMKAQKDPGSMEFRPGMRINKSQGPMVDCFLSESSVFPGQAVRLDSLNRESRRRDYMRIMEENMSILKRIQDRKPNYQRSKWEKERYQVEGYIKNIRNDATTGYLARSGSGRVGNLPYSPMASSSSMSRSSVSSSRKRLHRLPPMDDGRAGLRTAPQASTSSLPTSSQIQMQLGEPGPLMGEINPLPVTLPADPRVEQYQAIEPAPAPAPVLADPNQFLFKRGYKIGSGHYLVQFFCDEERRTDRSTVKLRIRGIAIGDPEPKSEAKEWIFDEKRLIEMFDRPRPWEDPSNKSLEEQKKYASQWFTEFLPQLKEEDAQRVTAE